MLHFYEGGTRSACDAAESATGPFSCPANQGIYIDTAFYDVLAQQLGARGDFARYSVIAHEYGHHMQHLVGPAAQVRRRQQHSPGSHQPAAGANGSPGGLLRGLETGDEDGWDTFADL